MKITKNRAFLLTLALLSNALVLQGMNWSFQANEKTLKNNAYAVRLYTKPGYPGDGKPVAGVAAYFKVPPFFVTYCLASTGRPTIEAYREACLAAVKAELQAYTENDLPQIIAESIAKKYGILVDDVFKNRAALRAAEAQTLPSYEVQASALPGAVVDDHHAAFTSFFTERQGCGPDADDYVPFDSDDDCEDDDEDTDSDFEPGDGLNGGPADEDDVALAEERPNALVRKGRGKLNGAYRNFVVVELQKIQDAYDRSEAIESNKAICNRLGICELTLSRIKLEHKFTFKICSRNRPTRKAEWKAQRQRIKELMLAGKRAKAIKQELHCSWTVVARVRRGLAIPKRHGMRCSEEREAEIAALLRSGTPIAQIKKKLKCGQDCIDRVKAMVKKGMFQA